MAVGLINNFKGIKGVNIKNLQEENKPVTRLADKICRIFLENS
jgi:hypothetical protein